MARGNNLFGERRGLEPDAKTRIGRSGARSTRCGGRDAASSASARCPGFTINATSPMCSREAASIWSLAIRHGCAPKQVPAELRRRLAGRYRWWRGGGRGYANRPDLAVAFLERSLELAASGGHVALPRSRQAGDRRIRRRRTPRPDGLNHPAPRRRPDATGRRRHSTPRCIRWPSFCERHLRAAPPGKDRPRQCGRFGEPGATRGRRTVAAEP